MFKIETVQYYLAPLTAPVPTAIAVGATLHYALLQIPGIDATLALVGGAGGGIATEVSGGLMFSMAAKAFLKRQWGAFWVALLGSLVYVVVVGYAVSISKDSTPVVAAVFVSGLVYVAVALYQYFRDLDSGNLAAQARQDELRKEELDNRFMLMEKEAEIERIKAETEQIKLNAEAERLRQEKLLEAAKARAAKYAGQGQLVQPVQSVQRRTTVQSNLRPEWLQMTRELLAEKPKSTTRDIADHLGAVSPSTGKAYRDAVWAEQKSAQTTEE